jgi:hypothetical protein
MANRGIFLGWNRPIAGREVRAGEMLQLTLSYFSRLLKEGKIESFEPVLLTRHGGDLNGFILVRGDKEQVKAFMDTTEFKELMMRVDHVVTGLGIIQATLGDELMQQVKSWSHLVK